MRLIIPDYYTDFSCIAGDCRHSCCEGWEIDVDEDTCEYYRSVEGAFGDELRVRLRTDEEGLKGFALTKEGRCPFLNADGLCRIYAALGEDALGEICTEYPRFTNDFFGVREKGISISCETAARLVFGSKEPLTYCENVLDTSFCDYEWDDDELGIPVRGHIPLKSCRDTILKLLQDRTLSLGERVSRVLSFGQLIQECINSENYEKLSVLAREESEAYAAKTLAHQSAETETLSFRSAAPFYAAASVGNHENYLDRLSCFAECEILDEEWRRFLKKLRSVKDFDGMLNNWRSAGDYRAFDYERLLVYFVHRYAMKAVYDGNFLQKLCFSAACVLMIRDMDALTYWEKGTFGFDDRIDVCRIFSREFEHSEDNLDCLEESFLFEGAFSAEQLMEQSVFLSQLENTLT